jgi:hypothetical protein
MTCFGKRLHPRSLGNIQDNSPIFQNFPILNRQNEPNLGKHEIVQHWYLKNGAFGPLRKQLSLESR